MLPNGEAHRSLPVQVDLTLGSKAHTKKARFRKGGAYSMLPNGEAHQSLPVEVALTAMAQVVASTYSSDGCGIMVRQLGRVGAPASLLRWHRISTTTKAYCVVASTTTLRRRHIKER